MECLLHDVSVQPETFERDLCIAINGRANTSLSGCTVYSVSSPPQLGDSDFPLYSASMTVKIIHPFFIHRLEKRTAGLPQAEVFIIRDSLQEIRGAAYLFFYSVGDSSEFPTE